MSYTDEDDGGMREYQESLWQSEYQEWIAAMEAVGEGKQETQNETI